MIRTAAWALVGMLGGNAAPAAGAKPPASPAEAQPTSASGPSSTGGPPNAAEDAAPGPSERSSAPAAVVPATGSTLVDRVLPCGLRVLVAQDDTLPVVAVVLSLELGSEDDPVNLPGLHHALAYQLLQGNRSTPPNGVATLVQDAGGRAFLATGPAQIRFESIAPVSVLDELIEAESQRLRAPSVTEVLWADALASARRDTSRRYAAPAEAMAAAHGASGLGHDGRAVPPQLSKLSPEQVAKQLAQLARYEHATLVVVAPQTPSETLSRIERAFSGLPRRARAVASRTIQRAAAVLERPKLSEHVFVRGVDASMRHYARAWCHAINRQRATKPAEAPGRLRCRFDSDPRRSNLVLRARVTADHDAETLVAMRIAALESERGRQLIERELRQREAVLARRMRTPLDLARLLSASVEVAGGHASIPEALGITGPVTSPVSYLRAETMVHVRPSSGPAQTPKQPPVQPQDPQNSDRTPGPGPEQDPAE